MLDIAADRIVLASIEPDANTVSTAVDLNPFDALGRKRATTFRAYQNALTLSRRLTRDAGCGWEGRRIQRRRQQCFSREPESIAESTMRESRPPNGLHLERMMVSRTVQHDLI